MTRPVSSTTLGRTRVDLFCEAYAELLVEATGEAATMAGAFLDAHPAAPRSAPAVPIRLGRARRQTGT